MRWRMPTTVSKASGVWPAGIFAALSPHYMFVYWRDSHQHGWELMSGVLLCITGVEAMYADLGHFSRRAVQVCFAASLSMLTGLCLDGRWQSDGRFGSSTFFTPGLDLAFTSLCSYSFCQLDGCL